jgi:glycosyltransferase involved in cell wall biosynthesis
MRQTPGGRSRKHHSNATKGIVFGVLLRDAEEDWSGRNQLLLSLSRYGPVVLLESRTEPKRLPMSTIDRIADNLYVVRSAFALRSSRFGRKASRLAAAIDGAWFRRNLRSVGISEYVFWLTVADPVLTLGVPPGSLLYDCADPNFLPEGQREFDAAEREVATRAALTFSTAHSLRSKMQSYNPRSLLLPNATSRDFHPQQTDALPKPTLLRNTRQPVVGYLGTIDWRFDAAFVLAAALAMPDCTFAVVGRVNDDQRDAVAGLRRLPNVVMPGQVGYHEGISWVAAFDVGIIPFTIGVMNDAINPVKMYMYLMAGLPVVATAVAECQRNDLVSTATTPDEFARLLQDSIAVRPVADRQERIEFAMRNTWDIRADQAVALLQANGLYAIID